MKKVVFACFCVVLITRLAKNNKKGHNSKTNGVLQILLQHYDNTNKKNNWYKFQSIWLENRGVDRKRLLKKGVLRKTHFSEKSAHKMFSTKYRKANLFRSGSRIHRTD